MTDQEFLHAFESGRLSPADFHHRDHLRLAWLYVNRLGPEAGTEAVSGGIVAHASQQGFDATLARHPMLLRRDLPLPHSSRETLYGDAAREAWVQPDLIAFPFD